MMFRPSLPSVCVSSVFCASLVSAYSFVFTNNPQQCATLSLQITGSGVPPYSVLVVPYGPSPLANNVEVRMVLSQQFTGDASSLNLTLNYPENSQFVAVVSDSSGFATGGTSAAMSVMSSADSSCFNSAKSLHPDYYFNISPNQLLECNASMLWWDPSTVQGNVNFQGVIPGGESFSIPVGMLTNAPGNQGTGFNWTPSLLAGTTVLVVAGDQRGLGTGGSEQYVVTEGSNSLCITNTSPTSTSGPPAGGIVTESAGSGSNGSTSPTSTGGGTGSTISSKELAAIVGGSVGGLAAIIALGFILLFIRRNKKPYPDGERRVNLLHDDPDGEPSQNSYPLPFPNQRPEAESYYITSQTISSSFSQPTTPSMTQSMLDPGVRYSMAGSPVLSDKLTGSPTQVRGSISFIRQSGATSFSDLSSPPRPDLGFEGSAAMTGLPNLPKQPTLTVLRPVNIIQHEDAGTPGGVPQDTHVAEPVTIELPPAYTNIS